jgi:hypothetical protein
MQCPFSIRHEVLPDVNCQLRGFDDDVDVFSQMISPVQPIRKQDANRNNQSTPSIQSLHSIKSRDKKAETHTSFDMSRKEKRSKDQTKALFIPFTLTQGDLVQETLAVTLNEV